MPAPCSQFYQQDGMVTDELKKTAFLSAHLQFSLFLPHRRRRVGGVSPFPRVFSGPGGHCRGSVPHCQLSLRGTQRHAGGPDGPQAHPGPFQSVWDCLRTVHGPQPRFLGRVRLHGLSGADVQPVLRHPGGPDLRQPEGRRKRGELSETKRLADGSLSGFRLSQQAAGRGGGAAGLFSPPISLRRPAPPSAGRRRWPWRSRWLRKPSASGPSTPLPSSAPG